MTHFSRRCLSTKEQEASRKAMIDRFIRVDHAGEFGADRIYAGQLAVLGPKGMSIITVLRKFIIIEKRLIRIVVTANFRDWTFAIYSNKQ